MRRITTINNRAPHTMEASKALEEITTKMAQESGKSFEITGVFAQNHEHFNEAFSKVAELYGYEIQQKGRKFFLSISENNAPAA